MREKEIPYEGGLGERIQEDSRWGVRGREKGKPDLKPHSEL